MLQDDPYIFENRYIIKRKSPEPFFIAARLL